MTIKIIAKAVGTSIAILATAVSVGLLALSFFSALITHGIIPNHGYVMLIFILLIPFFSFITTYFFFRWWWVKSGKDRGVLVGGILGFSAIAIYVWLFLSLFGDLNNARERAEDSRRIVNVYQIQSALHQYNIQYHHFPLSFEELPSSFSYPDIYTYTISSDKGSYHLGVNLATKNNVLKTDADATLGFDGGDEHGCHGELGFYCFDLTEKNIENRK